MRCSAWVDLVINYQLKAISQDDLIGRYKSKLENYAQNQRKNVKFLTASVEFDFYLEFSDSSEQNILVKTL